MYLVSVRYVTYGRVWGEPAKGPWEKGGWEDEKVGNWVAGTGANLEEAAAGGEADAEP